VAGAGDPVLGGMRVVGLSILSRDSFRHGRVATTGPTHRLLEHLEPFEAPGLKSGDIFVRIGCKTDVGGSKLSVTPRRSRI
jgi:hypothetical protein